MDYRGIKVHVPTPEISKLVQEKLFEEGCQWSYSRKTVRYADKPYLYTSSLDGEIAYDPDKELFKRIHKKQVHYLQVLVGDDSGTLFRYCLRDRTYYQLDGVCYWVDDEGRLKSNPYDLDDLIETHPTYATLLNVNEEEIMQDNSNEMPTLEAGKHVVRTQSGNLHLVVDSVVDGLSGIELDGTLWSSNIQDPSHITEVHRIPKTYYALRTASYGPDTLIWKRDDKAAEARKQYDELQRQIKQLQEQADKLGEKL